MTARDGRGRRCRRRVLQREAVQNSRIREARHAAFVSENTCNSLVCF
jgi:hypothetical protein